MFAALPRNVATAHAGVEQHQLVASVESLCIVGPAGLALERTCVLTVDPDEGSRPARAEFVIAQDEPLGFGLSECRCRGRAGQKGRQESAGALTVASIGIVVISSGGVVALSIGVFLFINAFLVLGALVRA